MLILRQYKEKVRASLWSLIYEYRCAANWSADTSQIITMRINKWTKAITVIDKAVICSAGNTAGIIWYPLPPAWK